MGSSVPAGGVLAATAVDRVLAFVQPQGAGFINVLINNGAAIRVREFKPTADAFRS